MWEDVAAPPVDLVTNISGEMGVYVYSFQEGNLSQLVNVGLLKYVKHNISDVVELLLKL